MIRLTHADGSVSIVDSCSSCPMGKHSHQYDGWFCTLIGQTEIHRTEINQYCQIRRGTVTYEWTGEES